jgi:hypothetical protein
MYIYGDGSMLYTIHIKPNNSRYHTNQKFCSSVPWPDGGTGMKLAVMDNNSNVAEASDNGCEFHWSEIRAAS